MLGSATAANLKSPAGIVFDSSGNLYIGDTSNSRVRKVDTNGNISTFAGTGDFGDFGDTGVATKAGFNRPYALAIDKAGNMYIADTYNSKIKVFHLKTGILSTFLGGSNWLGQSLFHEPAGLSYANGKLYVADTNAHRIRVVDLKTKEVSTLKLTGVAAPPAPKEEAKK